MGSRARSITVALGDDERLLADALAMSITHSEGIRMVAPPCYDPDELLDVCRQHRPAVALTDLVYNGVVAGVYLTAQIRKECLETQVIAVTGYDDPHLLLEAVEAGAAGFLKKSEAVDRVLDAIRAVAAGRLLIEPSVLVQVAREAERAAPMGIPAPKLTPREKEVLQLLRSGCSNREIAERLSVSTATVATHVHHILEKLGARSRLEAVVLAGDLSGD